MELFSQATGVKLLHVPYKGSAPRLDHRAQLNDFICLRA
jgi:hypothetical protein